MLETNIKVILDRNLKTITSAGSARRSATKNRSVLSVREDVEALANTAIPIAVGFHTASKPRSSLVAPAIRRPKGEIQPVALPLHIPERRHHGGAPGGASRRFSPSIHIRNVRRIHLVHG